jgi:hypothetical protein
VSRERGWCFIKMAVPASLARKFIEMAVPVGLERKILEDGSTRKS